MIFLRSLCSFQQMDLFIEIINQIGFQMPVPPVSTSNPWPGHHLGLAATTAFPATTQRESSAQTASGEPPWGRRQHVTKVCPFGILFANPYYLPSTINIYIIYEL